MVSSNVEYGYKDNQLQVKEKQSHQYGGDKRKNIKQYLANCGSLLLDRVIEFKLSKEAKDLYLSSWDEKTRRQYRVYLNKWLKYCESVSQNPFACSLRTGIQFLVIMFKEGYSYSTINTARSAMSNVLQNFNGDSFGKHPVVCRVMRGIYRKRPQLSRYQSTWDVNLIFELFREWGENRLLSLKFLTMKLAVLMLLTSCQRVQTLSTFKISDLFWNDANTTATFRLSELLKHSRRGTLGMISFQRFDEDPILCVVRTLRSYLYRTENVRKGQDRLFLGIRQDHQTVCKVTIARWVRWTMKLAGIEIAVFKAHSVRGASTSKMAKLHLPIKSIMQKASWKSETTFRKFYQKEVIVDTDIAHAMLKHFVQNK